MKRELFIIGLSACIWGCGQRVVDNDQEKEIDPAAHYNPQFEPLEIISEVSYPNGFNMTLYDDKQQEKLASIYSPDGKFELTVDSLPVNEVYFLTFSGKARAFGIDSMSWEERIPVFHESGKTLQLQSRPYAGLESVSKVRFYIDGSDEQQFLNEWQKALDDKLAEIENRVTQTITIGGHSTTAAKASHENPNVVMEKITAEKIEQRKPLMTTMFLIYTRNDHRSKQQAYREIYDQASESVKRSKYGVDLRRRIERITSSVSKIDPNELLNVADEQLMPLDTAKYNQYSYWLLSFWTSHDKESIANFPQVEQAVSAIDSGKVALLYISLDSRFSRWRENSMKHKLTNSYMVRAETRQQLIDELYLSELPRYLLMRRDGTVVMDDIPVEELTSLLETR